MTKQLLFICFSLLLQQSLCLRVQEGSKDAPGVEDDDSAQRTQAFAKAFEQEIAKTGVFQGHGAIPQWLFKTAMGKIFKKEVPENARNREYNKDLKGCGKSPTGALWGPLFKRGAWSFNRPAEDPKGPWNAFCEMGWSLCPDAVVQKDYYVYAKTLGPDWVKLAGDIDGQYCKQNGWLTPEMLELTHDFEALQAKGKELCDTKYAKYDWKNESMKVTSITRIHEFLKDGKLDKEDAEYLAAWNCALGSVSCDITYCNYGYCNLANGTLGQIPNGCPGWDVKEGMPLPGSGSA